MHTLTAKYSDQHIENSKNHKKMILATITLTNIVNVHVVE